MTKTHKQARKYLSSNIKDYKDYPNQITTNSHPVEDLIDVTLKSNIFSSMNDEINLEDNHQNSQT